MDDDITEFKVSGSIRNGVGDGRPVHWCFQAEKHRELGPNQMLENRPDNRRTAVFRLSLLRLRNQIANGRAECLGWIEPE